MAEERGPGAEPLRTAGVSRLVVFAPNWLGDAVMALPAVADVQRAASGIQMTVAARPSIAPLFELVPGLAGVLSLDAGGPWWRDRSGPLRAGRFDAAVLLPNSFHSAFIAWRAGIRERWGYATDFRRWLLTRSVSTPMRVHQGAFYQHLTRSLGFASGSPAPSLDVSEQRRRSGTELLRSSGWDGTSPIVAFAPGAAYGGAKKWAAASFAAVASMLAREGIVPTLIGSAADAPAGQEMMEALPDSNAINLIGRTDLPSLAGVLVSSRGLVTNDSGAMHLASALGVPVTAIFGPTDDQATHPRGRAPHTVLTHDVWCRPCMLRECPLTHACMRGVTADSVAAAVRRHL